MLLPQLPDQVAYLDDLQRVKVDGRLVQNDILRIAQQRLRNTDTLAVPLGQVANQPMAHFGQACLFHHARDLLRDLLGRHALCFGNKAQVFCRCLLGVQRRNFRQVAQQLFGFPCILKDIAPVDAHTARRGGKAAGHNIHCGGFSRAIRSQKAVDMSVFEREGYIVHRSEIAVFFAQVFHCDHIRTS